MGERTILRKRCSKCGGEALIDVTEDLRPKVAADKTIIPGVPLHQLTAAPFKHDRCPGEEEPEEAGGGRFVAGLVVYELLREPDETGKVARPNWNEILRPDEELLGAGLRILGGVQTDVIEANSAADVAGELAERLGERWQTLAGSLGVAEAEVLTVIDDEEETDGGD